MNRKITLFVFAIAMVFSFTVLAQKETKVTKQIKVFKWLNEAVVDGNQVEGGLHAYDSWATLTTDLKLAQVKNGMLVTILDPAGDGTMPAATYRLINWADNKKLPANNEWERVADGVVVKSMTDRDILVAAPADDRTTLAIGTIVVVNENDLKVREGFVYLGYNTADSKHEWLSLGTENPESNVGYIYVGEDAATPSAFAKGFYDNAGTATLKDNIDKDADGKLAKFPGNGIEFELTKGSKFPYVALPSGWNKPSLFLDEDGSEYLLSDCWTVSYIDIDGAEYQLWLADVAFLNGASGTTYKLIIK